LLITAGQGLLRHIESRRRPTSREKLAWETLPSFCSRTPTFSLQPLDCASWETVPDAVLQR
jgi:hypothetical protein